jgi:hypothetical protein
MAVVAWATAAVEDAAAVVKDATAVVGDAAAVVGPATAVATRTQSAVEAPRDLDIFRRSPPAAGSVPRS